MEGTERPTDDAKSTSSHQPMTEDTSAGCGTRGVRLYPSRRGETSVAARPGPVDSELRTAGSRQAQAAGPRETEKEAAELKETRKETGRLRDVVYIDGSAERKEHRCDRTGRDAKERLRMD